MTLSYLFSPIKCVLETMVHRYSYGACSRSVHYNTNMHDVQYVGRNGHVYTIIQDAMDSQCKFDRFIYDASWTPDGEVIVDVTDTLRSLCGPMGNMHGYPLTLAELATYLASARKDCDVPWTEEMKLVWTNQKDLTTYEVSDRDEILDFTI